MYRSSFAGRNRLNGRQKTRPLVQLHHKGKPFVEGKLKTPNNLALGMREKRKSHLGLGDFIVRSLPFLFEPPLVAVHATLLELAYFVGQNLIFPFRLLQFTSRRLQFTPRFLQEPFLMLKWRGDVIHEGLYGCPC